VDAAVLTAAADWKYIFAGLPRYDRDDGHEIAYTLSEDAVGKYTTAISGDMGTGFVVTNTAPPPPGGKTPKTGDGNHALACGLLMLASGSAVLWLALGPKKKKNK